MLPERDALITVYRGCQHSFTSPASSSPVSLSVRMCWGNKEVVSVVLETSLPHTDNTLGEDNYRELEKLSGPLWLCPSL